MLLASLVLLVGCARPGLVAQRVDEAAAVAGEADRLMTSDGAELPLYRWAPKGDPRALVLALHSFGDFGLAFEEIGPRLAEQGALVLAPDQRGFGSAPGFGRWWGEEQMVADAVALANDLRATYPDRPLVLLGESMGGAVAMLAGERAGADALVLAAPAIRQNLPFRWAYDLGLHTAATLVPGYEVDVQPARPELTPIARTRLAQDPRVLRAVRTDTYWGLIRLANAASALNADDLPPTVLLFGGADDVVPDVSLCTLGARLAGDIGAWVYGDAGHRLLQEPATRDAAIDWVSWLVLAMETQPNALPANRWCPTDRDA